MTLSLRNASALVVIDVQQGFDDPRWGHGDNPDCEDNVGRLIAAWRATGWPVVYVRHDSGEPDSPLRPGQPGNAFKPVVSGEPDLLVTKQVNSAFYGEPALEPWLRQRGIGGLVICGITTNHCCETTARMAGNLGYRTFVAGDACATFGQTDLTGRAWTAQQLHDIALMELHGEFATVAATADLLPLAAGPRTGRAPQSVSAGTPRSGAGRATAPVTGA